MLLAVALAVGMRLAVGIGRGEGLVAQGNGLYYMHDLAVSIASGEGFRCVHDIVNVFQQPAYPALLALGYVVAGVGWQGVLVASTLVGALTVWAVLRLAEPVAGPRAALVAAIVVALHPLLVWHGLSVADTMLFSLALVGWLGAMVRLGEGRGWREALLGGVFLGVGMLTRPSILPLLPIAALAVLWRRGGGGAGGGRGPRALQLAASLVLAGLIVLPWALRNHELTGRFPLIGTHGPESMWSSNSELSPKATEMDSSYDAIAAMRRYRGTDLDIGMLQCHVEPADGVRRHDAFSAAAREWITANPGEFARMSVTRLLRMWSPTHHPQTWWGKELRGAATRSWVHALVFVPLTLLGLAGAVLVLRRPGARRRAGAFTLLVIGAYSASHAAGAGYSRVRFPVDPLVAVFAAVAIVALWDRLRPVEATSPAT